jgi:DNA polymerase III subunit epsilon
MRSPGVYLFYGLNAHPLYIGKSITLKSRIAAHFYDVRSERELRLIQETQRIEHVETAGDVSACVLEAQLIKERLPAHNIALRRKAGAVLLRMDTATGKPIFVKAIDLQPDEATQQDWFGPFGSRASARAALLELCREHALCAKTLGLERAAKGQVDAPCFARQMRKCMGACERLEALAGHTARVQEALQDRRFTPWPFAGAVALVEENPARFAQDWIVANQWRVLGRVKSHDAAQALAASATRNALPLLDADVYNVLKSALARQGEHLHVQPVG